MLLLYFREELTMKAIGRQLGLSESRISQLMTATLGRLRRLTQPLERADVVIHTPQPRIISLPTRGSAAMSESRDVECTAWLLVDEVGNYSFWGYESPAAGEAKIGDLGEDVAEMRESAKLAGDRFGLATEVYELKIVVPRPARLQLSVTVRDFVQAMPTVTAGVRPAKAATTEPEPEPAPAPALPAPTVPEATAAVREPVLPQDNMIRTCSRCREEKPQAAFRKDSGKPTGHSPKCKSCEFDEEAAAAERRKSADPPPANNGKANQPDEVRDQLRTFLSDKGGSASHAGCCAELELSESAFRKKFGGDLGFRIKAWGRGWTVQLAERLAEAS